MRQRIILVAVLGTSPAVLTETVWALAHLEKPVVPDEVVVLTTLDGEAALKAQLFGAGNGWQRLLKTLAKEGLDIGGRLLFGETQQSVRLLSDPQRKRNLADIATSADNAQMADDLIDTLRGYTEDASTQVYASIAGGRKTMGALMLSCMSLLGRERDHVLHVLVNPPFDGGVEPVFLFPEKGVRFTSRSNGGRLSSKDAKISLIDIPFVKMRGWYQDKFKTLPPRYSELVRAAQSSGPEATVQKPLLDFEFAHCVFRANGKAEHLSATEFTTLSLDLLCAPSNLLSALSTAHAIARKDRQYGWFQDFGDGTRFSSSDPSQIKEDLTKVRHQLRKRLLAIPSLAPFVSELVPRGTDHGSWPAERISADIPDFWKCIGL